MVVVHSKKKRNQIKQRNSNCNHQKIQDTHVIQDRTVCRQMLGLETVGLVDVNIEVHRVPTKGDIAEQLSLPWPHHDARVPANARAAAHSVPIWQKPQ